MAIIKIHETIIQSTYFKNIKKGIQFTQFKSLGLSKEGIYRIKVEGEGIPKGNVSAEIVRIKGCNSVQFREIIDKKVISK